MARKNKSGFIIRIDRYRIPKAERTARMRVEVKIEMCVFGSAQQPSR